MFALKNYPLIIVGPSGVGKGTLIKKLMEKFKENFEFSISWTTRKPRQGEIDGKDYMFVDIPKFKEEIEKNQFIEYCNVHDNFYGTHKEQIKAIDEKNKICLLEIDIQGALKVHKVYPESKFLFINTSEFENIEKRLRERGTEKEDVILKRVANSKSEIEVAEKSGIFKFLLNDDLSECTDKLINYLKEEYPSIIK